MRCLPRLPRPLCLIALTPGWNVCLSKNPKSALLSCPGPRLSSREQQLRALLQNETFLAAFIAEQKHSPRSLSLFPRLSLHLQELPKPLSLLMCSED